MSEQSSDDRGGTEDTALDPEMMLSKPEMMLSRKNLVRGGAAALLGAATVAGIGARAEAAPVPPHQRGRFVRQADPRVNPVIDVKAWGAVGDGKTDDTTAIQAALDAARSGETVLFPDGRYRVTSTLKHAGSIGLVGAGQGVSWIDWQAAGDAIRLTFSTTKRDRLVISGLTVNAARAKAGTAISAVWSAPAAQGWPHAEIEDLEVTRGDGGGQRWERGVYLEGAWMSTIRTYCFLSAGNTGVGLELEDQCVDCNITDLNAQSCDTGVLLGSQTEGTVIINAVILDALHGVTNRVNKDGRKGPWVTVCNSHMNTRASGVTLSGTGDSWITDNLFYKFPPSTSEYTAVRLTDCRITTVRGNEIFNLSPQPTTNVAIDIQNSTEVNVEGNTSINLVKGTGINLLGSPDARVQGNHNRNVGTGIRLGAGSDRTMATHNAFRITDAAAVPNAIPLSNMGKDNLIESNTSFETS